MNLFSFFLTAMLGGIRIYVADTILQGNKTEQATITALDVLEQLDVELVVIVRGGGSKTDIFYLNNEAIARRGIKK